MQQSRRLSTRPPIRICDPLRLIHLLRHPPLQPRPITPIPPRLRLPLQSPTLRKSLSPRSTSHLPHVREPPLPKSPPRNPATTTTTEPEPPAPANHALIRLLSHAEQLRNVYDFLQGARGDTTHTRGGE